MEYGYGDAIQIKHPPPLLLLKSENYGAKVGILWTTKSTNLLMKRERGYALNAFSHFKNQSFDSWSFTLLHISITVINQLSWAARTNKTVTIVLLVTFTSNILSSDGEKLAVTNDFATCTKVKGFIDANRIENKQYFNGCWLLPIFFIYFHLLVDVVVGHIFAKLIYRRGKLQMTLARYLSANHTTNETKSNEMKNTMLLTIVRVSVSASCLFWSLSFCTLTSCCPFGNKVAHL